LDDAKIQALSESLQLDISVWPLSSDQLPMNEVVVQPLDANNIAGYGLLADINGNPALLIKVGLDRGIIAQGRTSVSFFITAMVVIGLIAAVIALFLLERIVLSRIVKLRQDVAHISTTSDISYRVATQGRDELAELGNKINEMLDALNRAQKARQISEDRLRTLVNNAPVILWAVDLGSKFTFLDGHVLSMLNVNPDMLIGKPVSEAGRELPLVERDLRQALNGETITATMRVGEYSFATHYVPLKDANGQVTGVVGVATNVTERVAAERSLAEAIQSLSQKNRQFERAHELLRSTVEQLSDAVRRGASHDELRDSLEVIEKEFQKL
jgi:PAS domain S-box-containing protein